MKLRLLNPYTTVTIKAFDTINRGTSDGEGKHRVYLNGDVLAEVADGGTVTMSPGDEYSVLYDYNNSELGSSFYPALEKGVVKCAGTVLLAGYLDDKPSANVTMKVFNSDDSLINSGTDTEVLGTNEEVTMLFKVKATSEDSFGSEAALIVFDAHQLAFSDIKLSGANEVSAPGIHSSAASFKAYAFEVPAIMGSSYNQFDLTLKTGATNPGISHNVTVTFYDKSLYVDAETGEIQNGYSDEDNGRVGYDDYASTIYVS